MTLYYATALLADDADFLRRVTACVAIEVRRTGLELPPEQGRFAKSWTDGHVWEVSASPGFGEAYDYALSTGVENPGRDPAVITDEQILAAVSALLGTETP